MNEADRGLPIETVDPVCYFSWGLLPRVITVWRLIVKMATNPKRSTASSISDTSGITHLPNDVPSTVDMVEALLLASNQKAVDAGKEKTEAEGYRLYSFVTLTLIPADEVREALGRIDGKVTKSFLNLVSRFGNPSNEPAKKIRDIFGTAEFLNFLGKKDDGYPSRIEYLKTLRDPADPKGKRTLAGANALQRFANPPSRDLILKRLGKALREINRLSDDEKSIVEKKALEDKVDEKGQTKETALDFADKVHGKWAIVPSKSAAK